jgi:hypothetical protein
VDTSAARESCSSGDVACRFGCCALRIRSRPSQAASTSNDGRGVCPVGFPPAAGCRRCRSRSVLPATSSSGTRAIRGKKCAQLRQPVRMPTVGLWQMCFITRTCRSRLISCEHTSRPFLTLETGTGTCGTTWPALKRRESMTS